MCVCVCGCVSHSVVSDSETPWTVACQAPLWNSPEIGIYPNNECVRDTSKQWQLQKWTLVNWRYHFLKVIIIKSWVFLSVGGVWLNNAAGGNRNQSSHFRGKSIVFS